MRGPASAWPTVLAYALVSVGLAMFFLNGEALTNGDAVECDGSPMRPGQWCVGLGDGSTDYDEEKRNEARGVLVGCAGIGLITLGCALLIRIGISSRRGNHMRRKDR